MEDGSPINNTSFYVRSAYRFTSRLKVNQIQAKPDARTESARPGNSISLDNRLQGNYERMLGQLLSAFWSKNVTGANVRKELVGRINERLSKVLEIQITDLGNVSEGKGQLFFEKGTSKNFPFENLSSGEKEVVDMLIDLEVKLPTFNNTVFCIDEPELHLNTAIQRKLLTELADMLPKSCQLWVATHSIGFLRALQQDLREVLDFSEKDYFHGECTIRPIVGNRADWQRIFSTALEDLTGLLAPETIVYCEGRSDPSADGDEQGLDAQVYNTIFESNSNTLFVSSGGGGAQLKHSGLALKVLSKAFRGVGLKLLKDRDELSDADRTAFLDQSTDHRMLLRREIENYLFDKEVLGNYALSKNVTLNQKDYDGLVSDITSQDLKAGQTLQKLGKLVGHRSKISDLKLELAKFIVPGSSVFAELNECIFSDKK
jgi:hypothetical protein